MNVNSDIGTSRVKTQSPNFYIQCFKTREVRVGGVHDETNA